MPAESRVARDEPAVVYQKTANLTGKGAIGCIPNEEVSL